MQRWPGLALRTGDALAQAHAVPKAQKCPLRSHNKENVPRESHQADGVDPTPGNISNAVESGDQSVCAVCMGSYEDDITDGVLQKEWARCMNISCGLWMHCDCLSTSA